jgi:signal transduction histidine kinase
MRFKESLRGAIIGAGALLAAAILFGWAGRTAAAMFLVLVAILGGLLRLRRAERRPLDGRELAAKAMEAAGEGCVEWNVRQGTVFVSGQWLVLHGLDHRQSIRAIDDVRRSVRIHADDCPALRAAVDEHLHGRSPRIDADYRVQRQDGSWRWLQLRGRSVRDDVDAAARLFCTVHDISDRKDAEVSRVVLETHLQQAHRMEALGTFAGGIAHDFNNLLGAILGFGDLAREQADEGSAIRRHIDRVLQAGWRARALVQRVMQFSRAGTAERNFIDMQGVVEQTTAVLAPSLPDRVSLQAALDTQGVRVMGDAAQLLQVVANLCMNAVEAIEGSGGVRLRLATMRLDEARTFLHGDLAAGPYVRLEVEDSGKGMSAETIGRMFEPFFTTKLPGEGTGLGLSVVHGVVAELGGAIDVRSELGAGTCIAVWLPLAPSIDVIVSTRPASEIRDGQVVAIVDDEPLLVELAQAMIVKLGYVALPFGSSASARAAFDDAGLKVDLLLTDEKMPGLSGSELIAAIRAKGWDIPVIVMSGDVTAALEQRARTNGVCALLRKPLTRETLAAALARCLGPSRP